MLRLFTGIALLVFWSVICIAQPKIFKAGWTPNKIEFSSDSLTFLENINKVQKKIFSGLKDNSITIDKLSSPELAEYGAYFCSYNYGPYHTSNYGKFISAHLNSDDGVKSISFDTYCEDALATTFIFIYDSSLYALGNTTILEEQRGKKRIKTFKYSLTKDRINKAFKFPTLEPVYNNTKIGFASIEIIATKPKSPKKTIFNGYLANSFTPKLLGDSIEIKFEINGYLS